LKVTVSGQVETMRESYDGLFTGIALAIVLVYLFLVMNFQSWIDPLIVLMAVPFALAGTHGYAHVHRADDCEQHFGGEFRQSTHGCRR
jgi:multidrug efflux pump subunit AcrB